ncbi:MAG: 6-carboxytetrahydropterin synthase QueD [Kiritimatiellales bacterium]|nr:6-carboxytetrahydropterin synthase QueD [Kiritimatiellales bacterium]
MAKMRIYKEFKFDAAHRLTRVDEGHKCGNLHGHTFVMEVHLEGEVDPSRGWILDFNVLSEAVDPIIDELDHSVLNEIEGLQNPTSEIMAVWFWNKLKPRLPQLSQIVVKENPGSGCVYCGD